MTLPITKDIRISFLNAFAGFGGNTELLDRDKFSITHIEHDLDRYNYLIDNMPVQDTIIHTDAYDYILANFANFNIVWASPDCDTHSIMRKMQFATRYKNPTFKYPDLRLYELILFLQHFSKLEQAWIVENVIPYYKPLLEPSSKVGRHLIWSNKVIIPKAFPPDQVIHQHDKKMRNKMNPEIGKYIIDQLGENEIQMRLEL